MITVRVTESSTSDYKVSLWGDRGELRLLACHADPQDAWKSAKAIADHRGLRAEFACGDARARYDPR